MDIFNKATLAKLIADTGNTKAHTALLLAQAEQLNIENANNRPPSKRRVSKRTKPRR